MRTYEEIRRSLRRQAIAKLVGLGLLAFIAASTMIYGLVQGGRAIWAALTSPRTLVVRLAPAMPPVRVKHAGCAHPGCPYAAHPPCRACDDAVHVDVPHVVVHVPHVHRHWHHEHWSW